MGVIAFLLYTLKIGRAAPEDFEEVIGLGGRSASVAVFLVNVLSTLGTCGLAFCILGELGLMPGRGDSGQFLVLLCGMFPLILLVRALMFWGLRGWCRRR